MAKLYLFNTRTRTKEEFVPINESIVRTYHCGPTVYGRQHIGNLRAFVLWDFLRRTLEYNGYAVKQIVNITDFGHLTSDADSGDDKMMKGLKSEGWDITLPNMLKLGRKYEEVFLGDLESLHVEKAFAYTRASEHIKEQIELIQVLEEKGFTYTTSDGVYFDTSKDPEYGAFAHLNRDEAEEYSRLDPNSEKKNQRDFALWKYNGEMGWDSLWGQGFPGWHIECSAMSEKHLGVPFDIHTGGIEHIPIHHTNEIAQTENAREVKMASYWLHNNHLQIDHTKIAKSVGNTVYLQDIVLKGYSPLALRYFFLTAHYRSEQNFTWEALDAASSALMKLEERIREYGDEIDTVSSEYKESFIRAINDDLNMPQALALTWELIKDPDISLPSKKATLLDFDQVFGFGLKDIKAEVIPSHIHSLIQEREAARHEKEWEKADRLRLQIEEEGYVIKDTDNGTEVSKAK